jgi:K(+)-stimulated pyrophosphate-energized sodium pump
VESIAAFSKTGTVTNIISGLSIAFDSNLLPTVMIIAGIPVSYFIVDGAADPVIGIYGISIVSTAMFQPQA